MRGDNCRQQGHHVLVTGECMTCETQSLQRDNADLVQMNILNELKKINTTLDCILERVSRMEN